MDLVFSVLSEINVSDNGAPDLTAGPKMEAFHPHLNAGVGFKQGAVGRNFRLNKAVKFFAKDPACLDANIAVVEYWIKQNDEHSKERDRLLQIQLRELELVKKKLLEPAATSKRCPICKESVTSSNFARHMDMHQVRPAFQCESCKMEFTRVDSLKRHSRIHSDGRAFNCAVCEYNCGRKDELTAHMRKAHCAEK